MAETNWKERWQKGQISFHQAAPEALLTAHFGRLGLARGATVFVPLCGKSLDLLWLAEQGHPVVGVELSALACEAFFAENRIAAAAPVREGPFRVHRAKERSITLYEGDFFELDTSHVGRVDGWYDRAALIALPEELRRRYVHHLKTVLLAPHSRGMLLTVEYDQSTYPGPPYSVPPAEVHARWQERFRIEQTGSGERSLPTPLLERAWLLTPLHGSTLPY